MSCLHTINKSTFSTADVATYLERLNTGDAVIFIEDGAYNAVSSSPIASSIQNCAVQNISFYVIENDLLARGLENKLLDAIKPVDYLTFVRLSAHHNNIISWY